jgi:nucleoside-diphosphate-sugar epimerase
VKCLVTGATGFVGRPLCRRLLQRGDEVIALGREGSGIEGVSVQRCDLADAEPPAALFEGIDTVLHLAAIAHRRARIADYENLNHRATLRLAQQAEAAGIGCFVFVSSVRAMGAPVTAAPRSELDCRPAQDPYGQSKWHAESALRKAFADSAMSVQIVRPTVIYGPGVKGNLRALARGVRLGLPRPPEAGRRSMLAVEDLVDLLCLLAERRPPGVHTWIASGDDYSTRELHDSLRRALGCSEGKGWLPTFGWRAGCALLDALGIGEDSFNKLFGTELYDSSRVRDATGWRPRGRFEAAAADLFAGVDR